MVTLSVLLSFLFHNAAASVNTSLLMQSHATVTTPPVTLLAGTAGSSTIYTNNTSAKVSVAAPVWLSGWNKRAKVTLDHNDIASSLSNFSVLVCLSNSSGTSYDNVTFVFDELQSDANRKKIAITTSDGITQCYVEIEKWDTANKKAWLWVKVPSISNTTDTDLYLYYDKDNAENTVYVGDTGSTPANNVWDSNFKGVYHLQGDPSSTGWGKTDTGYYSVTTSHSRAMGGTSPNVDNMFLKSVSIYLGAQTGNVRLAVYTGGQLDNPTSATLLWDAGTVNPNGVAGWHTINHPSGGVSWPKNTVTWLAWKRNTGVAVYYDTSSSYAGDFQTARGRNDNSFSQDPAVAFPSTYGQQGTFGNAWYSIYVSYNAQPLKDSTSNQNNPTSQGSMTSADQVTGKIDGSIDFDGTNDELQLGNAASLQITGALTVEAWAKPATTGSYMGIGGKQKYASGSYAGYALSKTDSNYFRFQIAGTGIDSNSSYADTNWHYLVGRYSGTTYYLYVDGVQQVNTGTATLTDSGQTAFIGRQYSDYDGRWWSGTVDEFRISNATRSAEWIKASYESERDNLVDFGSETIDGLTYDYVLRVVNQLTDAWNVNLKVYDSSNIARLSNAIVSFHDGTSSNQIIVSSGSVIQSEGALYSMAGSATIYISINNLQAYTTGTSLLYVYLKILTPNKSTYARYVITFEIT
jgi:hypothetical protein